MRLLLLASLVALPSCLRDDEPPPPISDLTIHPATISVGSTTTVRGMLHSEPSESESECSTSVDVTGPRQQPLNYPHFFYGSSELYDGSGAVITWSLDIKPLEAGTYHVTVSLENDYGVSNQLEGTFAAQ